MKYNILRSGSHVYCSALFNTWLFLFVLNRNLQAAIGAYYDFESPNVNTPSMSFVEDVTIGEGESVPPDTPFTKTWRIQNAGAQHAAASTCSACAVRVAFLHLDAISARPHVSYHLVVLVAELCFDFSLLCYRCRVVATWGLSQIHRRGSVWPRERSDGEVTRTPGDMRCERADAKSHGSGHVPGPVEDVHGQRVILRR